MQIDSWSLWHTSKTEIILDLFLEWTAGDNADFFDDKLDVFIPPLLKQFPATQHHSSTCKKREIVLIALFSALNFSSLALKRLILVPIHAIGQQKLHLLLIGLLSFVSMKMHQTFSHSMTKSVKENQKYSDIGDSATILSRILWESSIVLIDFYSDKAHESFRMILKCWMHSLDTTNVASLTILDKFLCNFTEITADIDKYSTDQLKVS